MTASLGGSDVIVDATVPTVTITANTPHDGTHTSGTVSYIVTFSEVVTGFVTSDIILTGTANDGSLEVLRFTSVSGSMYTFDIAVILDGTVSVSVIANTADDLGGNGNDASNTHTVTVNIPPLEILSAVWSDSDELDSILSDGDKLTITFNQNTDMAGFPMPSKSELDAIFDFGGTLGTDYTGVWSNNARTLVITIVDSTDADAMIGDTISPFRGTTFIRSLDTTGGAAFLNPNSVGTNSTGHVFVGDTFIPLPTKVGDINSRVQIFHPDGSYAGVPDDTGGAAFSRPAGIATNSTGYTFIADHGSDLVQIFDPSGVYAGALVTAGDLTFREPAGVAIGKDDMIYVSDTNDSNTNERDRRIVQIFDQDGTYAGVLATTVNTEFDVPLAVATNSSGHVFVADSGNDNIRIFDSNGENTSNIDTTGPTTGSALRAVATNSTDHLFVVYNNAGVDTVQVYTASGVYAGEQSFGDDVGLGTISGIAVGSDDKIIVSERSNADLRSKDAVHIFGHQVLYSDTGLQQFESADAITEGDFGMPRVTVGITTDSTTDESGGYYCRLPR